MSIANVTLSDTFSQWVVKTNQLIVQSEETNTLAVAAFNTANDVSYTAANISAEILSTNNAFIINISNQLISSGNLTNAILSNTDIMNTIYTSANTITSEYLVSNTEFISNITINVTNELLSSGNLTNAILSNTIITNTIYDNANSIATAFNANSNLGLAWNTANSAYETANSALANTDSYTLVINNLTITGNLILSGPDAVLNML